MAKISTIATPARRRFDSPEQEAYLHLWRTYDLLKGLEDQLFREYELSAQQYNAMRLLQAAHPQRMATQDLGRRMISRAPDMTRLLDRLEERGWIERERLNENRRVVLVGMTPAGISILKELADRVVECHQAQLGHLTPEQIKTLVALLSKCREPHESAENPWLTSQPKAPTAP